jgi:hypothetical protein
MQKLTPLALALAAGPLALPNYATAAEVAVDAIRLGLTPGRTRVVFDLSGAPDYRLQEDAAARQVAVTLDDADTAFDPSVIALGGSGISAISVSQADDGSITYVFTLANDRSPSLFALQPYLDNGHRLVLDLYADGAVTQGPDGDDGLAAGDTGDTAGAPVADEAAPATAAASTTTAVAAGAATTRTRVPRSAYFADEDEDGGYGDSDYGDGDSGTGEFGDADYDDGDFGYDYGEEDSGTPLSGYISMEPRLFFDDAAYSGQEDQNLSFAAELEYYRDWDGGAQRLAFRPFGRYDLQDDERSHADIRELYWRIQGDQFLFKAGLDVVFWGVAESRHLVDIINQTDLVENIDTEDKLGQPMLNLDYMSDGWGTWQFYVLPWFREQTFPGEDGRLRPDPAVDEDDAEYESGDEEEHIDFAVRWSHYIGDWDIGIAHFSGTSRDPLLLPEESGGELKIIPYYAQIDQTSLDTQATLGAWLWKLEAIYNDNDFDSYYAFVGGFEYTFYGVAGSDADMGLLMEYNYDDRGENSTSALQEDAYLGLRWSGNDTHSTELLAALVYDTDNQSTFGNLEASRRLGEHWTLGMEVRIFTNVDETDLLRFIEDDDYAEIQITRHF